MEEINSNIGNIIPDELRPISGGNSITYANYLTRTPAREVLTPSGQAVVEGMDLNQIAQSFDSTVTSLAGDFQIPQELLGNSPQSEVTNHFTIDSLTNIPFTYSSNYFDQANVFTDANQLASLLGRISDASLGTQGNLFCDADDDDNLIQIKAVDAAQSGGIRAKGGNDRILGTDGNDIVNGNEGNDQIVGAGGDDLLQGGVGNDWIAGGEGDDLLQGYDGDDNLFGGAGNDVIRGGAGSDELIGNEGNDILIGEGDGDFLMGSTGADQFILRGDTLATDAAFADRILDFNHSEGDLIKIAYFNGTQGMNAISLAAEDVNRDGIQDTAILCSGGVMGVMLSIDPTQINLNLTSSILMVGPQDTALSSIGNQF